MSSYNRMQSAIRYFVGGLVATVMALAAGAAWANPSILVDAYTGRVIEHKDAFQKWYPASLTKLMTAYVTFDALKAGELTLNSEVVMSQHSASQPPSKMYFKPGQRLTLDSALKIMLVKSANDIAVAVAETVGGSEPAFVNRMNAEAAKLGMTSTHFINANGLPGVGQYTTARDLALLTLALKRNFPQYAGYFKIEGINTGKRTYGNFNALIGRFKGADGMKTGYICASGYNQVSSATRDGRSVISVVLGTDSLAARAERSADMLTAGLSAPSGAGVPLMSMAPDVPATNPVADISQQMCDPKARRAASETSDGDSESKSPYLLPMDHQPNYVFAGLLPGGDPAPKIANVPVPIPRPAL